MSGGSDKAAVPSTEKKKTQEKSSSTGTTASTTTPTLDPTISSGLKSQFGEYLQNTGRFEDQVDAWRAAGFTPDQIAGFQSQRDAVSGANFQTPMDELLATARGDYLYGGPGFDAAVDAAYRAGVPRTLSQFGGAGRDENFLGKANLNQIFADAFAGQYGNERARQLNAAQLLPQLSLLPGQTLQDIGGQAQALEQYGINTPLSFMPQLLAANQGALNFAAPFQGSSSTGKSTGTGRLTTTGTASGTPSYFPGSQTAGIFGGALSGAGTGAMLTPGMPLLGGGIGAIGGGLMGSGMFG